MDQRRKPTFANKVGVLLSAGLVVACGFGPRSWGGPIDSTTKRRIAAPPSAYSPEDVASFSQRFRKEIWPLLTRTESNCSGCHTASNASQLHLVLEPDQEFRTLLSDGHFDPENPASLLARVTAPAGATHMPPAPFKPWSDTEIALVRAFVNDLFAKRQGKLSVSDEEFPTALLTPFHGKTPRLDSDNTFLTYTQLRGKVKAIFGDDWRRDDRDLFIDNLAQFGGADFVRSFNESAKPTAQFLSGVDALSRDVASRAYLASTGPFAGRPESLPSPLKLRAPDTTYRQQIAQLYRRLLFRDPTPDEMQDAFRFIQDIYRAQPRIAEQDYELRFELVAKDIQGLETRQGVSVHAANDGYGLGQTLVDQNYNAADEKQIVRRKLDGPFTLKAGDRGQTVTVNNINTHGNVIVHGLEMRGPLPATTVREILVTDAVVQPQGAWKMTHRQGIACYEDENANKGASSLIIPLDPPADGKYELTLEWRKGDGLLNSDDTLVEVKSHEPSRLALPQFAPVPPKGEARFAVDESDDTVSFRDLNTAFRFGPGDGVEISNSDTHSRVVADAVRFVPVAAPGVIPAAMPALQPFLVPAKDATGQSDWKEFKKSTYSFYQSVGPRLVTDDNKEKGKLKLLYSPASEPKAWQPDRYYRVEVGYPGEAQNDTAVPIRVHAQASSPITRISHPVETHVGALTTLDASGSYNLQATPLTITWRQVGGAYVKLADPHAARITFTAPPMSAQQAAWEGLCRALMKHPDFLFTRPLSLASTQNALARRRLQLVKIAQDLVGRTPSPSELAKLDQGSSLGALVDGYLNSPEFQTFYFHRIRLYLESHGTEEEDEPARLWSYICFHDRPFKEILTADYTVDTDWNRQSRPDYCGHSGVLTMKGFIKGKPGLPHFNYAAQVCEKFLGYVFEVPLEIVKIRNGIAAASTTSPSSVCYSCHKILTPLAYQRSRWTDLGVYQAKDSLGHAIDDSDHQLVPSYAFKGTGLEAFSLQAQNKERFIRTILQTHFILYFGREMRYEQDERDLYRRLWQTEKTNHYSLHGLIRALVLSPEYLGAPTLPTGRILHRPPI